MLVGAVLVAPSLTLAESATTRFTLGNGLRILIEEDHRIARVGVAVVYSVGDRDDPIGFRGLTHLVEHAMSGPTAHIPEGTVRRLESVGATTNGITTTDETWFFSELPAHAWRTALWVESDRMAYTLAALDQSVFEHHRAIVKRERRERGASDFADQAAARWLYPMGHPYRHVFENESGLERVDLNTVQWFFQRAFQPANAALAIVGDIDTAAVREACSPLVLAASIAGSPYAEVQLVVPIVEAQTKTADLIADALIHMLRARSGLRPDRRLKDSALILHWSCEPERIDDPLRAVAMLLSEAPAATDIDWSRRLKHVQHLGERITAPVALRSELRQRLGLAPFDPTSGANSYGKDRRSGVARRSSPHSDSALVRR